MTRFAGAVAALALAACGGGQRVESPPEWQRIELDAPVAGLSGLTRDADGSLWAIAERDRRILHLGPPALIASLPLDGVPEDLDTEALADLGGGRVAIGTESSDASREVDWVLLARRDGDRVRVEDRIALPYAALDAAVDDNDGIEGLCAHDGELLAAVEHVQEEDGERHAALARRRGDEWEGFRLRLTTDIGKLSALACRTEGGVPVAYAVERGLGPRTLVGERRWVTRILRFALPTEPAGLLTPQVVLDLSERMPERPNVEGLAVDDEAMWLIVDNHYGRVTGPNLLFRIPRPSR